MLNHKTWRQGIYYIALFSKTFCLGSTIVYASESDMEGASLFNQPVSENNAPIANASSIKNQLDEMPMPAISAADQDNNCFLSRGNLGSEMFGSKLFTDRWAFDDNAFTSHAGISVFVDANTRCDWSDNLSVKASGTAQYTKFFNSPGSLEGKQSDQYVVLNELVASIKLEDKIFLDLGKILPVNGFLFGHSPLDLVKNPSGHPKNMNRFIGNEFNQSTYREGSLGVGTTIYDDSGTYSAIFMPQLADKPKEIKSTADWGALERTNSETQALFTYTSAGLDSLTYTISLLLGDQKTLAVGINENLTDNLLFTVESSLSYEDVWGRHDPNTVEQLNQFEFPNKLLSKHDNNLVAELAGGFRHTTSTQQEVGIEYYYQHSGYNNREWNSLIDTIDFVNGGYLEGPLNGLVPEGVFKNYARGLAAEIDNLSRQKRLLGRHYATAYFKSNNNNVKDINYSLAMMMNLQDKGMLINVQISQLLTEQMMIFAGLVGSAGPSDAEFTLFGQRLNVYGGLNYKW